jgi:putative peptide zinc metalloprotease protein
MAEPFLSASWYRVAELRPELRAHARIHRQRFRGQAWYVLHDSASGKLHRFSPAAYRVIQLLDGQRTIDSIWAEVAGAAGSDAPTQDEVIRLLAQLHAGDLLQADVPPDVEELAERGHKQKRQKLGRASSTRCRSASRCGTRMPFSTAPGPCSVAASGRAGG